MIPYFLLIGLPLLFGIIGTKYRITAGKRVLFETQSACIDVFMLTFLCLLAFRGLQCGTDTRQYMRLFNEYSASSFSTLFSNYNHEFGFKLLNRIVGLLSGNFQTLLCITSVICVLPLWKFYKQESEDQLLTVALFLTVAPFMMYFSGIRQAIAISLSVPAWYAAKNKRKVLFALTILLAMQFHTSAFILLLIYPLYSARITPKWLWFVVPCMIVVYLFRTLIFNYLLVYLWKEYHETEATGATTILLLLILFGLYSYILPNEKTLDNDTIAMRNMLLLSIVIQIFAMLHPLSMRMNYYFLLFIPILIPKIANRSKKQFAQVSKLSRGIMTIYFIYYFVSMVLNDNDALNIFPYIPFWTD